MNTKIILLATIFCSASQAMEPKKNPLCEHLKPVQTISDRCPDGLTTCIKYMAYCPNLSAKQPFVPYLNAVENPACQHRILYSKYVLSYDFLEHKSYCPTGTIPYTTKTKLTETKKFYLP